MDKDGWTQAERKEILSLFTDMQVPKKAVVEFIEGLNKPLYELLIWGVVLLTVANIAALGTIAYHRFGHSGERHHENQHACRGFLHRELALSDAQAAQMKALKESFQSNAEPIRVALNTKREQLLQFFTDPDPDRAKIDSVQSEMDSLQSELQKLVIDHILDEKKNLTPEQQSRFFSIIRERLMMEQSHHEQNGLAPIDER